jgi:hypothetical protein
MGLVGMDAPSLLFLLLALRVPLSYLDKHSFASEPARPKETA